MKLKTTLARLAALSVLALATGAANAALYNFTISGDYTASWQMDSNVVPDSAEPDVGFVVYDQPGTFSGAISPVVDLTFYSAAIGGGMSIRDFYGELVLLVTDGPQLYSGPEAAPVMSLGSFALTEFEGSGTYTLSVSAVPEPATVAMMLAGLGLVGAAARRTRAR